MSRVTVLAPGSIGNVGPGFDVLGLAVEGIGDRITLELTGGEARIESVTGLDAGLVPTDPERNTAMIAARAWLRSARIDRQPVLSIQKGLRLAGGLGGSAASAVGGALAAALAAGSEPSMDEVIAAALEAESVVAGRHLDNIAATALGGLVLVRSVDPIDVVRLTTPSSWRVVLVTPHIRVETKAARAGLPREWDTPSWTQQMANTAGVVHAFASEDGDLLRRALEDRYAEPSRSRLIPRFDEIKSAALEAGAFGCSISGSGPTIFAISPHGIENDVARAMDAATGEIDHEVRTTSIAQRGAQQT